MSEPCVLPEYSEELARMKLARHLARGEEQYIWHCPWAEHWHCTDRSLVELVRKGMDDHSDGQVKRG